VPGTGGEQSINVTVTKSEDGVYIHAPSDTELKKIIDAAKAAEKPVSIDLSGLGDKHDTVTVPSGILSGVGASDAPGLAITMPNGEGVSFDAKALEVIASAGSGDLRLQVRELPVDSLSDSQRSLVGSAPVLDLTAFVGTTEVHDFGGGLATVSIPVTGEPLEYPIVWRMKTDADGKVSLEAIECTYNPVTNCYEFSTESFSEYALGNYPFTDTPDAAWYYENVVYAYVNGLFSGTEPTLFSPETAMTRAMLVTVLWRMEHSPTVTASADFSDVISGAWYSDAVAWAVANGIVNGYGEGKFGPDDEITREQTAAVLYRYAQHKSYDVSAAADIISFKDAKSISGYAVPAMRWACGTGLIQGSDSSLSPKAYATRAQVAAILHRFNGNMVK